MTGQSQSISKQAKILYPNPITLTKHHRSAAIQGDQFSNISEILAFNGHDLSNEQNDELRYIAHEHLYWYANIIDYAFPKSAVIYPEEELIEYFIEKIQHVLFNDDDANIVILDRGLYYILERFFRKILSDRLHYLSITRQFESLYTPTTSGKTHRAGDPNILTQLRMIKSKLSKNSYLIPLDDSIAETGTILSVQAFAAKEEIDVDINQTIAGVKITRTQGSISDREFPNIPIVHTHPYLCSEARESYYGAQFSVADRYQIGLQTPFMLPFSDGSGYNMNGMIHFKDISIELLSMNILYFKKIEKLIGENITLNAMKRMIPSDLSKKIPQQYLDQYDNNLSYENTNDTFLAIEQVDRFLSLSFLDYLEFSMNLVKNECSKPTISVFCLDIDGTKAELKNFNQSAGFRGSVLESEVMRKNRELLEECYKKELQEKTIGHGMKNGIDQLDIEFDLTNFFINNYSYILEQYFDDRLVSRMEKLFAGFYGHDLARCKVQEFLEKFPKAYHVYRMRTWNHDIAKIYPRNSSALQFLMNLKEQRVRIIDITAAPLIHALKTLIYLGISSDDLDLLYSVEDLYDLEEITESNYCERGKDKIFSRIISEGVPPEHILMLGDQNHSDIQPAQNKRMCVYPVGSPQQLSRTFSYIETQPLLI